MSAYGNVPEEDVQAIQEAVRIAEKVAATLPHAAPAEWNRIAYEICLDGILEDWVMNGTNELDEGDLEDLENLLRVSVDTATSRAEAVRETTFRIVFRRAMDDWTHNWNTDDE